MTNSVYFPHLFKSEFPIEVLSGKYHPSSGVYQPGVIFVSSSVHSFSASQLPSRHREREVSIAFKGYPGTVMVLKSSAASNFRQLPRPRG